jgi:hypothetical protein
MEYLKNCLTILKWINAPVYMQQPERNLTWKCTVIELKWMKVCIQRQVQD